MKAQIFLIALLTSAACGQQQTIPNLRSGRIDVQAAIVGSTKISVFPSTLPWDASGYLDQNMQFFAEQFRGAPQNITTFLPPSYPAIIADGASHPISGYFTTCAKAHAAYSFILAAGCDLTQQFATVALKACIASIVSTGTCVLPAGAMYLSDTAAVLGINKAIAIKGQGQGITKLYSDRDTNLFMWSACGSVYSSPSCANPDNPDMLSLGYAGLSGVTIYGDGDPNTETAGTQTKPAIFVGHAIQFLMEDVGIYGWGGDGLRQLAVWDSAYNRVYLAGVGNSSASPERSAIRYLDGTDTDKGFFNINNNIWIKPHLEHCTGRFLIANSSYADSNKFQIGKFEPWPTCTVSPIKISKSPGGNPSQRWLFQGGTYNNFGATPAMFDLDGVTSSDITGGSVYNQDPYTATNFVKMHDGIANVIEATGYHTGNVIQTGNSQRNRITITDQGQVDPTVYLTNYTPGAPVDLRFAGGNLVVDDSTAPHKYAIRGPSVDGAFQFILPINLSDITKDGITLHFRAISSTAKDYNILSIDPGGTAHTIGSIHFGTSWASNYQISIPHIYLPAQSKLVVQAQTGMAGITLDIGDLTWEDAYYTSGLACPNGDGTNWPWSVGDRVKWPQSSVTTTSPLGCECITAGTGASSAWRRGDFDPTADNGFSGVQSFNNTLQFTGNLYGFFGATVDNGLSMQKGTAIGAANIQQRFWRAGDALNSYWQSTDNTTTKTWWRTDWTNSQIVGDSHVSVTHGLEVGGNLLNYGATYLTSLSVTGGTTVAALGASTITATGTIAATGNVSGAAIYSGGAQLFPSVAGTGISTASGTITNTKPFNGCTLGGNVTVCTNTGCTTTASVPTTITCP